MISKNTENKSIGKVIETNVLHNSPIGSADCLPVIPPIGSGTESYTRLGDRVKPLSLTVKGIVALTRETASTVQSDLYVRVMVLSQKNIKVASQILAGGVDAGHLLRPQLTGLPQTNYGGLTNHIHIPINTDLFKVYMDKTIKLCAGTQSSVEQLDRASARWSCKFKSLPASLTFDDGNADNCNNFAPFLAIGYAYGDGTSPDVVATRVTSNAYSHLTYEDA